MKFVSSTYATTGPGCLKITTSLVYVSLKFQKLISQIINIKISVHQFSRSRLKLFFYLKPWRPFCSTERNGLNNFGRDYPRNIPVKLFQNLSTGLTEEVI